MTFVDSSCLGRFLDCLNYALFDGQMLKKVHTAGREQRRTPHPTPSFSLFWMPSSKSGGAGVIKFYLKLMRSFRVLLTFSVSMWTTSFASGFSSHSGGPDGSFKKATMD